MIWFPETAPRPVAVGLASFWPPLPARELASRARPSLLLRYWAATEVGIARMPAAASSPAATKVAAPRQSPAVLRCFVMIHTLGRYNQHASYQSYSIDAGAGR